VERSPAAIWETALGQLELQVTRPNFDTWLRDTVGLRLEDDRFIVGVASDFAIEWLRTRLRSLIGRVLSQILGDPISVGFEVEQAPSAPAPEPATVASNGHHARPRPAALNPDLTFATFVPLEANRLAHHAATQFVDGDCSSRLLILWGGPGLGKTHLLHAIAHAAIERGLRVELTSSERFVSEFVHALSSKSTAGFRARNRDCDLFILDEFDLLATKEQTQQQFYHLFNDLWTAGCRIALSTGENPASIGGVTPRMQSRIRSGLAAELKEPSQRERLAILQHKAAALPPGKKLPANILQLIARRPHRRVTELEGAFNAVCTMADLSGWPPSQQDALRALQPFRQPAPQPAPQQVLDAVSKHFSVSLRDLSGPSRDRALTYRRHVAMYLLRKLAGCSLPHTAALLGRRDHSTAINAIARISSDLDASSEVKLDIQHLYQALQTSA
jgi:chromosomal replication initiator protein